MLHLDFDANKMYTLLCLGAHCDDIEIGCGGTLLKLLERNDNLSCFWVVFCSTPERSAEAKKSAQHFLKGARASVVIMEAFRDGFLPYLGAEVKQCFETLKHQCSPDLIFTHYRDDRHQDHRIISDLTWNTFRNHLILEYEIPKYDGDIGQPNLFVPLNEQLCERKINTILNTFESQKGKHWFTSDTFYAMLRLRGIEASIRYAEAFFCRKIVL